MDETRLKQATIHQAGGGASASQRAVETIHSITLPRLKAIYAKYAGGNQCWDTNQIKSFLETVQKHPVTEDVADVAAKGELDFNGFLSYITSPHATLMLEPKEEDLSWPLSAYYISSSHNTYLSGNQLSSDSTTESYTNVLLRGCRCVEIDVWDGDESDSDTSDDEASEKAQSPPPKKSKRASTFGKIKSSLPDSLAAKLKRTSIGKKTEDAGRPEEKGEVVTEVVVPKDAEQAPEVAVVEPRVLHGYTLTKEISFRDVCVAIRENAFTVTDQPIIISLEVHCGPAQQVLMVNIMKEIWGDYLVAEPESEPSALPSPGDLRNKILIKVKYAPPGSSPPLNDSEDDDRLTDEPVKKGEKKAKPSKIIQELSRLGIFTKGISFKSLTQPEASMATHIFSLSEKKFLDYHEKQREELLRHNRDFLMRAYPSGLRIRSSNLNPPIFWGAGAQVVALNWQQTDEGMMLNEGMFAGTGGYVLKPQGYRPALKTKATPNEVTRRKLNLSITFLAAQDLPLPPGDTKASGFEPYVKVELHVDGSEAQQLDEHFKGKTDGHEREGEYKERTRTYRGCYVDMAAEKVEFKDIPNLIDELTFVRFTVRDDEMLSRDDLAAWACVRLDRLGEGYRFLHLIDLDGKLTQGTILVKVEKSFA